MLSEKIVSIVLVLLVAASFYALGWQGHGIWLKRKRLRQVQTKDG